MEQGLVDDDLQVRHAGFTFVAAVRGELGDREAPGALGAAQGGRLPVGEDARDLVGLGHPEVEDDVGEGEVEPLFLEGVLEFDAAFQFF